MVFALPALPAFLGERWSPLPLPLRKVGGIDSFKSRFAVIFPH